MTIEVENAPAGAGDTPGAWSSLGSADGRSVVQMSRADAEEYTQALGQVVAGGWRQVALGVRLFVPNALGLTTREWVGRLGGYVKLPTPERREAAAELTAPVEEGGMGMSQREAADVLGVDPMTVNRDLRPPVANATPEPIDDAPGLDVSSEPVANATPEPIDDAKVVVTDPVEEEQPPPTLDPGSISNIPKPNEGDEWYTPRWLFRGLDLEFGMDVCAPVDRTYSAVPAKRHLTIEDDGLRVPWEGTVWCNPPYSSAEPWARRMLNHKDGLLLTHCPINGGWVMDVFAECDGWRHFQAMEFVRPSGISQRPAYWLILAAFGPAALDALARLKPLDDAARNKRLEPTPMWVRA